MPDLSVETSLPKVHYCGFIRIALIIQVQNQKRSMRLITNMCFLASYCAEESATAKDEDFAGHNAS